MSYTHLSLPITTYAKGDAFCSHTPTTAFRLIKEGCESSARPSADPQEKAVKASREEREDGTSAQARGNFARCRNCVCI